ncbi:MAG: 23S rRNA (pseudouridine(1915)-N(3))-methyltransferase RlmH [Pseudomonadota bacterium]
MRLWIAAVGRLRPGPELALIDDYRTRVDRAGKPLALGPLTIAEVDDRKGGGPGAEAALLTRSVPDGAVRVALDERGKTLSSPDLADAIARWRDDGARDLAFFIGGADGLDLGLRQSANARLSFGPMVWPHMLARVMLTEQLYRAVSILAGTPYHRA